MVGTLVTGQWAVNGNGNIIGRGTGCVILDNSAHYDYSPLLSLASTIIIILRIFSNVTILLGEKNKEY